MQMEMLSAHQQMHICIDNNHRHTFRGRGIQPRLLRGNLRATRREVYFREQLGCPARYNGAASAAYNIAWQMRRLLGAARVIAGIVEILCYRCGFRGPTQFGSVGGQLVMI